jgi:hypothetical protein
VLLPVGLLVLADLWGCLIWRPGAVAYFGCAKLPDLAVILGFLFWQAQEQNASLRQALSREHIRRKAAVDALMGSPTRQ